MKTKKLLGVIANKSFPYRCSKFSALKSLILQELVELQLEAGSQHAEDSITVLKAMQILAKSWAAVKQSTIENCFRKAKWIVPADNLPFDGGDDMENYDDDENTEDDEYIHFDDNVATSGQLSDDDIVEMMEFEFEEALEDAENDTSLNSNSSSFSDNDQAASTSQHLQEIEKLLMQTETAPSTFQLFYGFKNSLAK